jgi:hypothetical protein
MRWFQQLSARQRRVLVGLVILTLSQFGMWEHGASGAHIAMAGIGTNAPVFDSVAVGSDGPGVSGWSLHPLGVLILPVLIGIYALNAQIGPFWQRWGLWITLASMIYCAWFTMEEGAFAPLVGWAGILVAASALLVQRKVQ